MYSRCLPFLPPPLLLPHVWATYYVWLPLASSSFMHGMTTNILFPLLCKKEEVVAAGAAAAAARARSSPPPTYTFLKHCKKTVLAFL